MTWDNGLLVKVDMQVITITVIQLHYIVFVNIYINYNYNAPPAANLKADKNNQLKMPIPLYIFLINICLLMWLLRCIEGV